MKACVITLGCKVNLYESEFIKESLIKNNYVLTDIDNNPDVIVINTCTVTNQADSKSRKTIRSARSKNKDSIIVVCGCFSEHHKEDILNLGVNILIGNKDKTKVVELINEYIKNNKPIVKFYNLNEEPFEDMEINNFKDRTRAFLKIQDGCNNYCSYCIIPYMRGNIKNKDIDKVIKEAISLTNSGYREIVLTGINTGSYGYKKGYNLATLLNRLSLIENLERIRISSIEITEINDDFLSELSTNSKICNHLHIPLQSGDNQTLKMMNRKYNIKGYKEIINKIRNIRPDINITTDVIVGFPTETDDNFNETVNNIKDLNFTKLHVFPYSKRDGTAASKMKNIVTSQEKKERLNKLLNLSLELENNYYKKFLNKDVEVLIESSGTNYSTGYTNNYIKVIIDKKLKQNEIYKGKVVKVTNNQVTVI